LPWVESVEVRKVYPKAIEVKLKERQAYRDLAARLRTLADREGWGVIAPLRDNKFSQLPLVVGRGAETTAASFDAEFASGLKSRQAREGLCLDRRPPLGSASWTTALLSSCRKTMSTWRCAAVEVQEEQELLDRDIAAVDLRLEDRTAGQLTPEAAGPPPACSGSAHQDLKKAGQNI
jgi:cell division protein FtsQ